MLPSLVVLLSAGYPSPCSQCSHTIRSQKGLHLRSRPEMESWETNRSSSHHSRANTAHTLSVGFLLVFLSPPKFLPHSRDWTKNTPMFQHGSVPSKRPIGSRCMAWAGALCWLRTGFAFERSFVHILVASLGRTPFLFEHFWQRNLPGLLGHLFPSSRGLFPKAQLNP